MSSRRSRDTRRGNERQHSLEQQGIRPSEQTTRRQRSAEEQRRSVNVGRETSAGSGILERPKVRIAWGNGVGGSGPGPGSGSVPDSESSRLAENNDARVVELVAWQIPRKGKTMSGNGRHNHHHHHHYHHHNHHYQYQSRMRNLPIESVKTSSTLLYSRQELAERLRLAWKQREANKSNIDVFLAHGTSEERSDSRLSSCSSSLERIGSPPVVAVHQDYQRQKLPDRQPSEKRCDLVDASRPVVRTKSSQLCSKFREKSLSLSNDSDNSAENATDASTTKKEELENATETNENDPMASRESHDEINPSKSSNTSIGNNEESVTSINSESQKKSSVTASNDTDETIFQNRMENAIARDFSEQQREATIKSKRASFRSGSNAAFSKPVVEDEPGLPREILVDAEVKKETTRSNNNKSNSNNDRNGRRTYSAPGQRRTNSLGPSVRTQVSIVIETNPVVAAPKLIDEAANAVAMGAESKIGFRSIKSAPAKRRAKMGKRRSNSLGGGANGNKDSSDARNRVASSDKNSEVVTMVSLVSDAESDSELEAYSPRDDKLISQLRKNLPTTPIIKSNVTGSPAVNALSRKPIKSVSFQQDSFDVEEPERPSGNARIRPQSVQVGRVTGSALPTPEEARTWRTEVTSLAITSVSGGRQHLENQEIIETSLLTDREKRCLIVPIGDSRSDKKRKLLRTRSTPPIPVKINEVEKSMPIQQTNYGEDSTKTRVVETLEKFLPVQQAASILLQASVSKLTESAVIARPEPKLNGELIEPAFQTTKEKECWHLYRRMCDKGVCVSFDTVLRGMLTPTEYRLRKKENA